MRCRVLGITATASWRLSPTGRSETSELVPCCSFSQFPHNTSPHLLSRLVPILFGSHFSSRSASSHPPCRVNSVSAAFPAHCAPRPCAQVPVRPSAPPGDLSVFAVCEGGRIQYLVVSSTTWVSTYSTTWVSTYSAQCIDTKADT